MEKSTACPADEVRHCFLGPSSNEPHHAKRKPKDLCCWQPKNLPSKPSFGIKKTDVIPEEGMAGLVPAKPCSGMTTTKTIGPVLA